jgi:hypothetical protein
VSPYPWAPRTGECTTLFMGHPYHDGPVTCLDFHPSTPGLMLTGSEAGAQGSGLRAQGSGLRAQGSGLRAQGSGLRAQGSGLRAQGSGLKVQGPGLRAQGLGSRLGAQSYGFRVCDLRCRA